MSNDLKEILNSAAFAASVQKRLEKIQAARREQAKAFLDETLAWLALAPSWTVALAEACDFPGTDERTDVASLLMRLKDVGFCQVSTVQPALDEDDDGQSRQSFSMTESMRREALQRLLNDAQRGRTYLQQLMEKIGKRIRKVSAHLPVAVAIARWAELAEIAANPQAIASRLNEKVEQALEGKRSAEALRYIESARLIQELLNADLVVAIERAAQRLELYHRREDDERRLHDFLERDEQIKPFRKLISGSNDSWALHYLGAGGMGKTMLVRYFTARLIPKELKGSSARIDFDYLNPNYPARAPGLLLARLAEELRLHDKVGAARSLFISVTEKIEILHERLSVTGSGPRPPLNLVLKEVFELLPTFAAALLELPQPVVIIFDTCEELAKIRPEDLGELDYNDSASSSIQVTFALIERLHDLFPQLRVVFSGRRPLASEGKGWRFKSSLLPARPYLSAHVMRGFTGAEVKSYLEDKCALHPDFVKPIKDNCLIKGRQQYFAWEDSQDVSGNEPRYHPFDLALYAALVLEDDTLRPETLSKASADRYIEVRIVGRINDPTLRRLLPAVALLGRFESEWLRELSGVPEGIFNHLFQELSNQEWINRHSSRTLEVQPELQPRLLAYYEQEAPRELEKSRQSLAAKLEKITLDTPLDYLDVLAFRTTLRLLRLEPERAAKWWRLAEARFASEQAWDWARRVCELLMGDEESDDWNTTAKLPVDESRTALDSHLRAAVRATYAAALLHENSFDKLPDIWATVKLLAPRHPHAAQIKNLERRALAGLISSSHYLNQKPNEADVEEFQYRLDELKDDELDDQLVASLIAAIEALIEQAEDDRRFARALDAQSLKRFIAMVSERKLSSTLLAFLRTLTSRLLILQNKAMEAAEFLGRAATFARSYADFPTLDNILTPQVWLDWLAPDEMRARILLESVRGLITVGEDPASLMRAITGESSDMDPANWPVVRTIDSDRLNTALLRLRWAAGGAFSRVFIERAADSRARVGHHPRCRAHRAFPPMFAAAAEWMASNGQEIDGLEMLQQQSADSESSKTELDEVHEADRAYLRVVRRLRLRDEGQVSTTSIEGSLLLADKALLWAVEGLACPLPNPEAITAQLSQLDLKGDERELAYYHARFRALCARPDEMGKAIIAWGKSALPGLVPSADQSFEIYSCFLDALELNLLSRKLNLSEPFPNIMTRRLKKETFNLIAEWHRYWRQPAEALTLMLRAVALIEGTQAEVKRLLPLIKSVGIRQAAQIALEEGELLALRLPDKAVRLLNQAGAWFMQCQDMQGALIARTSAALALIHSRSVGPLYEAISEISAAYTLSSIAVLLPWKQLQSIALSIKDDPSRDFFFHSLLKYWRPWLMRIIACLMWADDKKKPKQNWQGTRNLFEWFEANYGTRIGGETMLPPELYQLTIGKASEPKTLSAPPADPFRTRQVQITLLKPQTMWQPLQSLVPDPFHANVQIEWQGNEHELSVAGLLPYESLAWQLHHLPVMKELSQRLSLFEAIELVMDEYASWVCWEAVLGLKDKETMTIPPMFRRTLTRAKHRRVKPWKKQISVLTFTNDLAFSDVAALGLSKLRDNPDFVCATHNMFDSSLPVASPQVLLLNGTPVETSSGIRLDIAADRHTRQFTDYSRGSLLHADRVTKMFPDLSLCIIQVLGEAQSKRTQYDRELAAYTRQFGAELFRLGIPAVIVIPPLPPAMAHLLLEEISRRMIAFQANRQRAPFGPNALLDAVRFAREMIRRIQTQTADRESLIEAAFDICLYATDPRLWDSQ